MPCLVLVYRSVGFDQREVVVINRLVRLGKGVSDSKNLIAVGKLTSPSFYTL